MAFDLLVFDCDGVILESECVKTEAFMAVGELFDADKADWLLKAYKAGPGLSRHVQFDAFYEHFFQRAITETERARLNEVFRETCHRRLREVDFVPGVLDVVEKWRHRVPVYVCSGTPQEDLENTLKMREVDHLFTAICGSPPIKDQLLADIVKRVGTTPERTVMVGDSSTDADAAFAVGTHFYGRGQSMSAYTPHWGEHLHELDACLEQLWQCADTVPVSRIKE